MKRICFVFAISLLLLLSACGPSVKVQRVASDTTTDLSGKWNDTDSRLVAEEMIRDVLARPWLSKFTQTKGQPPVVIVGAMKNLSSEHIQMQVFAKDIARELLNSGLVRFVASRDDREELRDERVDQQYHASEESAKKMANEVGADFMLQGSVNTIFDKVDRTSAKFYQVDMHLIDVETNETVWMGSKEIKKVLQQNRYKM